MTDNLLPLILSGLLVAGAIFDLQASRIPNLLTLPAILTGLVCHSVADGFQGSTFSTIGMVAGLALLIIPYCMGGMGAGDVKLLGAVGSFLGAKATFEAFLFIAVVGGAYSAAVILIRRDAFHGFFSNKLQAVASMALLRQYVPLQIDTSRQRPRLKYGLAIAVGTITYLVAQSYGYTLFNRSF